MYLKVSDFSEMFNNCNKLKSLPDLSKWSIKRGARKNKMFDGCTSLKSLPNIFE